MFEFGNKEFRNLQEQVGKNKEDIATLKSGITIKYTAKTLQDIAVIQGVIKVGEYMLMKDSEVQAYPNGLYVWTQKNDEGTIENRFAYLGAYPAVVKGAKGDTGDTGATGSNGKSIYGVTATLPSVSSYEEGDMYLLSNANLYKVVNGAWVLQCSLKGSQGVPGPAGGTEVIANPTGTPTENLSTIKIDGTSYSINGLTVLEKEWLDKALLYGHFDSVGNFTTVGALKALNVYTNYLNAYTTGADIKANNDLDFQSIYVIKNLLKLYADEVSATAVNTDVIEAKTSGGDVEFGSAIDMGGHAIDNASEISAGGSSQTTGLVANFHGDAQVHGDMILDSADNLVDTDGNPLITGGGGGTQLYKHTIRFLWDDMDTRIMEVISTSSSPITNMNGLNTLGLTSLGGVVTWQGQRPLVTFDRNYYHFLTISGQTIQVGNFDEYFAFTSDTVTSL